MRFNTYPSNPFPPSTDRIDTDALETEVSELKSGLTNYETQNDLNLEVPDRKNLCDNGKNGVGYYDQTGTYQNNEHYATSDLIPVEQGKTYVASIFNKTTSERVGALVYSTWDASKNFVAQSTSSSITIGSGVSYVRIRNFQDQTSYIDNDNYVYQLEQGSTATSYAPYIPSVESRIEVVEERKTKWFAIEVPANVTEYDYSSDAPAGAEIISVLPTGGAGLTVVQCHLGQKKIYFASAPSSKAYARVYYY